MSGAATSGVTLLWLQFGVCSTLILVAGARLMTYGDTIAHRTGLGGTWVGMALLATVTSLPELVSGATAVTQAAAPDIAVGDVLGSCVFNLAMLAFVDALQPRGSAFDRAGRSHLFAGAFSVVCLALVGTWLAAHRLPHAWAPPGWLLALLLTALYLVGMRTIFRLERHQPIDHGANPGSMPSLRTAVIGYAVAGTVVVAAAIWLPFLAVRVAAAMGWSEGLVGTLLVALSTSLPELAVTVAAARSGALDLAIGNLLGSNLFNMVVLALDIALMLPEDLMARASGAHMASVLSAIVMSAAVMLALASPPRQRLLNAISWTSAALVLVFLVNVWLQLQMSH